MTSPLVRPTFFEGQILGAADLQAQVDYGRVDSALHERTEHVWGVSSGLELRTVKQTSAAGDEYFDVYLGAGVAVDPTGRRILVPAEQLLSYTAFQEQGVFVAGQPSARYPVYLRGIDEARRGSRGPGACATDASSRTDEGFAVEFGRPGSEINVLEQTGPSAVGAGPGSGLERVLVGFVEWRDKVSSDGRFGQAFSSSDNGQVKYAGVRASEIVALEGALALRTRPSPPRFAVVIEEGSGGACLFRFGKQEGAGSLAEVFRVDEKGNLEIKGTLTTKVKSLPLAPVVESGTAFHGLRVPLPAGITEDMVAGGKVVLHVQVRPRYPGRKPMFDGTAVVNGPGAPLECAVDADRRLRCVVSLGNVDVPASCDYLVVAAPVAQPVTP